MTLTPDQRLLRAAAAVALILPGIATALAALPALNAPALAFIDLMHWPLDGAQTGDDPGTRLLFAILGGITAGWGVLIWGLCGAPLARDPATIRPILRLSFLSWFVLDSGGSLLAGAPLNAALNILLLALFLWPLRHGQRAGQGTGP